MTSEIQWVPFSKRTLRQSKAEKGFFAFIGGEIIGSAYTFHDHPDENWYGDFAGERIGSCRDEPMAKANVEHRWKLARNGGNAYGPV